MNNILNTIGRPEQLKKLSFDQLQKLAGEIRGLIINTVAQTGGHLAPSLGVVELTLALHKVFDAPRDKIIWDVGHQAYVHKILTGRRDVFHTLRQKGGVSGFPKRAESAYDAFGAGHSSTSISAALGMALARDLAGQSHHVAAVIGDGSLTGGQAYEAMNNAGHLHRKLIVVLNDNEMSIDRNVGAVSDYLSKLRAAPTYNRVKRDIDFLLRRIPSIGPSVAAKVERLKDSLRYLLVPGELFEELGFTYVGPIDGHQIETMADVLEKAKTLEGPTLVHVITQKGRGYTPAEVNADKFHGVGPFCVASGETVGSGGKPSYTAVFSRTLIDLAARDSAVVGITAAMPEGTGLKKFGEAYPDRFFDVGIAEQHAVTLAAGLACEGKRPVVALYSTFAQRAYDQILHDVGLQKLPVTLALDRGGLVGEDGPTHHGVFDFSFLRAIPHMTIMAPKDESELRDMLYTAVACDGPAAVRYPRGAGVGAPLAADFRRLSIGKAEVLEEAGDIVLIGIGAMVEECRAAARILGGRRIAAGVVNARFVKPLDGELLTRLATTKSLLVTVEDHVLAGGFGSAVLEYLSDRCVLSCRVLRLGLPDCFVEHGRRRELLAQYRLTGDGIAAAVQEFAAQRGVRR